MTEGDLHLMLREKGINIYRVKPKLGIVRIIIGQDSAPLRSLKRDLDHWRPVTCSFICIDANGYGFRLGL